MTGRGMTRDTGFGEVVVGQDETDATGAFRIDDLAARTALGLESDEDLFLLMVQAHLPMPRLPSTETERMVASLQSLT